MGTLSEKLMYQMGDEELDDDNMVIHKDDVKEFIKELNTHIHLCCCEVMERTLKHRIHKLVGTSLFK